MPNATTDEEHLRRFNPELLMHRVDQLEEWRREMSAAHLRQVDMQHQVLLLDKEAQVERRELRAAIERCFETARTISGNGESLRTRVDNIEQALPMLRITSRWVIGGVLAAASSAVASGGLLYLAWRTMAIRAGV